MGFESAPRQTTADFLTSLTSPAERIVKHGYEHKTPRTVAEFVAAWKRSPEYATLMRDIDVYEENYPIGGPSAVEFTASRRAQQSLQQYVYRSHC
jgi:ATP-binding cassette, subfamily G (WHITE), member 2, PDR